MLTEQQRLERRSYIGASDAAIILGISPYKSPYELYLEKTGELPLTEEESDILTLGNMLEPVIIAFYEMKTGNKVEVNIPTQASSEHPFIRVNLDGRLVKDKKILIEAKSSAVYSQWGKEDDAIPLWYIAQCQQGMYVTDAEIVEVPVLIGKTFKVYKIERDEELIKMIVAKEVEFWNRVQTRNPPPISSVDDWKIKYDCMISEGEVEASEEILALMAQLRQSSEQIKLYEAQKKDVSFQIMNFMDNNKTLVYNGEKLGSIITSQYLDWDTKALENEQPELIEVYKTKLIQKAYFQASRAKKKE